MKPASPPRNGPSEVPTITPQEAKPLLTGGGEIAFVDVREAGQFGEGHPFFAVNIPYSRLELHVERLIPRKSVKIVLLDGGDGVAAKAAARLAALGYGDVSVMEGGAPGWAKAGYTLYKGVNVPSKTFGELVEQAAQTPSITAEQLHAMQENGEPLVLIDGRPPGEYRGMTIPGARNCPNAELGHRLPDMVSNPQTPIVVHCAGRTRSIIGAQSLINLGVENPVYALENGTQGWMLAGYDLEHGIEPQQPDALDAAALAGSRTYAETLIQRFMVPTVQLETLHDWRRNASRTLYLFDVRTAGEFEAGHLPGARHAPGGQLVQATDQWVATRGARIVLTDDTGLRAAQTALWLRRMGHEAFALREDVTSLARQESGPAPEPAGPETLPECAIADLPDRLARGAVLLDLRPSAAFREAHIEGARWAIRPRLEALALQPDTELILAGERGVAELAAIDLRALGHEKLSRLPGGPEEWREAELAVVAAPDEPPDAARIDYLFFVHDRHHGNLEAARAYLEWETALTDQLDEQERSVFTLDF